MRERADWLGVLDAIYAPTSDDRRWAADVVGAVESIFTTTLGIGLVAIAHDDDCSRARVWLTAASWEGGDEDLQKQADFSTVGPVLLRAMFYPPAIAVTHTELAEQSSDDVVTYLRATQAAAGVSEAVGVVVHPEPGNAVVLYSVLPRTSRLTKHERRSLSQLGLHLENALRLRRRPTVTRGFLDADGTAMLDDTAADDRLVLAAEARRIEGARRLDRGTTEPALELWRALVAGRYSLVPQVENGVRRYVVLENTPRSRALRALTAREVEVLSKASKGLPSKVVAYGLGISPSAVSSSLRDASAKLGLTTRLDLVRVAALLTGDPRVHASEPTLTDAERAILELLRRGMSNAEIARQRSRSVRTIANQVASLLRKTETPSRRALMTARVG